MPVGGPAYATPQETLRSQTAAARPGRPGCALDRRGGERPARTAGHHLPRRIRRPPHRRRNRGGHLLRVRLRAGRGPPGAHDGPVPRRARPPRRGCRASRRWATATSTSFLTNTAGTATTSSGCCARRRPSSKTARRSIRAFTRFWMPLRAASTLTSRSTAHASRPGSTRSRPKTSRRSSAANTCASTASTTPSSSCPGKTYSFPNLGSNQWAIAPGEIRRTDASSTWSTRTCRGPTASRTTKRTSSRRAS